MNQQVLFDYTSAGGRVFASHFHYAWFDSGPFAAANLATWSPGTNHMGDIKANIVTTLPNSQPFPKGVALSQWLGNTGGLTGGELPISGACHNADVTVTNVESQSWINADERLRRIEHDARWVFGEGLVASGEGARVHVVRSVVVCDSEQRAAAATAGEVVSGLR